MDTSSRRLVLVRHAKSDYPWGVDDHDRPLSERGGRDAPRIGAWLGEHLTWQGPHGPLVLVSSARRAQLTWSLACSGLPSAWDVAEVRDEPRIYESSPRSLLDVVGEVPADTSTLVMVGHSPGLPGLIEWLCIDDELRREALVKFPTSSVAVLTTAQPLAEAVRAERAFRVTAFAVPRG